MKNYNIVTTSNDGVEYIHLVDPTLSININDWIIIDNEVEQADLDYCKSRSCAKIVYSTDNVLIENSLNDINKIEDIKKYIPKIPDDILNKIINFKNKNNVLPKSIKELTNERIN